MAFFSRLTEIVTCNLTALLDRQEDPVAALHEIVSEMREGVEGATRSVRTAESNVERLEGEVAGLRRQIDHWTEEARKTLEGGNEDAARDALVRRRECHAVVDGLEQELQSAIATRDHLRTTLRALEARLADAERKQQEVGGGGMANAIDRPAASQHAQTVATPLSEIDAELAALKREMGQDG